MTLFKKAAAALLCVGLLVALSGNAEAHRRHFHHRHGGGAGVAAGVAAGIIGLGLLGAAAEADARARYEAEGGCRVGPLECRYVERPCFENDRGDYVCPPPARRCFRREYCD